MSLTGAQQMGFLFGAKALSEAGSSYANYQSIKAKGLYESNVYDFNARQAELDAEDALRKGEHESLLIEREGRQARGRARANAAASGGSPDVGSAADVQSAVDSYTAFDAMVAKNNSIREAFGYKSEAAAFRSKARFTRIATKFNARSTIITGATKALSYGFLSVAAFKTPAAGGFVPRNPTEAKFDKEYGG